jgi:hypothetical protein
MGWLGTGVEYRARPRVPSALGDVGLCRAVGLRAMINWRFHREAIGRRPRYDAAGCGMRG